MRAKRWMARSRSLARPVYGEEPQRDETRPVEMAVDVAQQLSRHLRARVWADRKQHMIVLAPRELGVDAIDARGRREDELRRLPLARALQQILGAADVHEGVSDWIDDRRSHARFGGQVHDGVKITRKSPLQLPVRAYVKVHERVAAMAKAARNVGPLVAGIIEGVEVIDTSHMPILPQQAIGQMTADEPRGSGYQDLAGSSHIGLFILQRMHCRKSGYSNATHPTSHDETEEVKTDRDVADDFGRASARVAAALCMQTKHVVDWETMSMGDSTSGFSRSPRATDYFRVAWDRKWIIIITVLLAVGVVSALSIRATPAYQTSTQLLRQTAALDQTLFGTSVFQSPDAQRQLQTGASLIRTNAVAAMVKEELQSPRSVAFLLGMITVSTASQNDVIRVNARGPDPQEAAAVANSFARQFIEYRRAADRSVLATADEKVVAELAQMDAAQLSSERGVILTQKHEELGILESMQTGGFELVQEAMPPLYRSHPRLFATGPSPLSVG